MTTVETFLEHHGVKGQKWGVRNDKGHEGERAKTKKIVKLYKKFARNANSLDTFIKVNNRAATVTNKNDVPRINNKPQYKGQDFTRDTPLRRKYYKEHQDAMLKNLEAAAKEEGTNASGTQQYGIFENTDGSWNVTLKDIKHADASVRINVTYDDKGYITNLSVGDPMAHTNVDEFLEHHGVKGQKWGIRNARSRVSKSRPQSSDSKKIAKLRKKHPSQLTNKQLRSVQERSNLERSFKQANPKKIEKGHALAKSILAFGATGAAFYALATSPAGKATIKLGKAFIDVNLSGKFVNSRKIDVSKFQKSAQGKLF